MLSKIFTQWVMPGCDDRGALAMRGWARNAVHQGSFFAKESAKSAVVDIQPDGNRADL